MKNINERDEMASKEELEHVESSQRQHYETLRHHEALNIIVQQADYNLVSLLKPKICQDGDQWVVLLGEDLQVGIAGFGKTPFEAVVDFNMAFHKQAKTHNSRLHNPPKESSDE